MAMFQCPLNLFGDFLSSKCSYTCNFYEHRNSYPYRLARTPPLYYRKNVKNPNKLLETSSNKVQMNLEWLSISIILFSLFFNRTMNPILNKVNIKTRTNSRNKLSKTQRKERGVQNIFPLSERNWTSRKFSSLTRVLGIIV